ncbi:hypothetical protein BsWGS_19617 [Bradybaena similaris]
MEFSCALYKLWVTSFCVFALLAPGGRSSSTSAATSDTALTDTTATIDTTLTPTSVTTETTTAATPNTNLIDTSAATTPASGASTASTGTTQSTPNTTKNGSSFNTPLASVILTSVAVIFFQMSHTFLFAK